MNVVKSTDHMIARIAAAIGEPARVRMLYCLLDGYARTATELSVIAEVSPSTASAHLNRLKKERLVKSSHQGKHRYYSLDGKDVANALEGLSIVAGGIETFVPNTPAALRNARTCYDHIAGALGVLLRSRLQKLNWIKEDSKTGYELTLLGSKAFDNLGIDIAVVRGTRRRFAYPCMDWSERQPHLGGALGAAILNFALKKKWLIQELDSRALNVTRKGKQEFAIRFGISL